MRRAKPRDVVDRGHERARGDRSHARCRGEERRDRLLFHEGGDPRIGHGDLRSEWVEHREQSGQFRGQRGRKIHRGNPRGDPRTAADRHAEPITARERLGERGVDACAREIALTRLFCMQSGRRFRALRMELERDAGESIDELRRSIASTIRGDAGDGSDDALMDVPVPPLPAWSLTKAEQERRAGVLSDVHGHDACGTMSSSPRK